MVKKDERGPRKARLRSPDAAARPKKIQTMDEFSRTIGLSRPTVSRYFNNAESVRADTRKRIEAAIKEFNYSPNFLASGLTRRRARAIGIIVPSIVDAFFSELVSTIELIAETKGYLSVLQCSHNDPAMERRALSRLLSMDVAGIAMAPLGFTSDVEIVEKAMGQVPILFMDSRLNAGTPYIGTNNRQSISTMVDYLCRSGAPPALFTMPAVNANVVERRDAYLERMAALGHEARILNPETATIGDEYEQYGFERFLTLPPDRIDGVKTILCPNDRVAFGLLAAAERLGLKVGNTSQDDIRVAGHDGQRFGAFASPSLTTSAQNTKAIGEMVANILTGLGRGARLPDHDVLFDGSLLVRDSA
jgi:DNA-binding LacI/PurR family transcriptional regulator